MRRALRIGAAIVCATGLWLVGSEGILRAKEVAAQVLLDRAWDAARRDGRPTRPWPWADLACIGALEFPERSERRIVFDGATDANLAFGVGLVHGTAPVDAVGNSVFAGHRSGAFAMLASVRVGETVVLHTVDDVRVYRVAATHVVDESDLRWLGDAGDDRLTLLTCHPFTATWRSSERTVVVCVREPSPGQSSRPTSSVTPITGVRSTSSVLGAAGARNLTASACARRL